jgi:hypothetical protein
MVCYDFDYAIQMLRQAVDLAELERDFVRLRKLVNEVEQSGHDLGAMDGRLNLPAGREVLMATLQSVADRSVSHDEALLHIHRWLNSGQVQEAEVELTQQYQFA